MVERSGGSYVVEDGTARRVAGTVPHPDGSRARESDGVPTARTAPAARPETEAARVAALAAEIRLLDLADPASVTDDGKPDATVLTDRLGWRVSKVLRNKAWTAVQAATEEG